MRLFVALDLPWEVKEELADLSCNIPGARWVPTDNFHLTLRFIGEASRLQAEEIDLALATLDVYKRQTHNSPRVLCANSLAVDFTPISASSSRSWWA